MSGTRTDPPPKVDPESLELRARPRPVRRINRKVLIAGAGLIMLALGAATILALDPPRLFDGDRTGRELLRTGAPPPPDGLDALPRRYSDLVPEVELGPPLPGDLGASILDREIELGIDPAEPLPFRADPEADAERAERIRQAQLARQGRESAILFQLSTRPGSLGGLFDAAPAQALPAAADPTSLFPTTVGGADDPNLQGAKIEFVSAGPDSDTRNPFDLAAPPSPYTLMSGSVIVASLVTGLNSDLPGLVIAQVTENAYDTATGRHLLIPQGTRLLGRYDSRVAYGQERALVVWDRLIFPNGSSILIDAMPATDGAGYAGLSDRVDIHTGRILRGIALSSLLGVATELTIDGENDTVAAIRGSAQESLNRAGQSIVERTLDVQPTLTVRPGWPVRVLVSRDLVLQPYGAAP